MPLSSDHSDAFPFSKRHTNRQTDTPEVSTRRHPIPSIGDTLSARYELRSILGSGSYGKVFAAWDHVRSRMVAIKVLKDTRPDSLLQFKQEFRALNELRHRNLVRFLKLGRADDLWFIVMELIEGAPITTSQRHDTIDTEQRRQALITTRTDIADPVDATELHHPLLKEILLPIDGPVTPLFSVEELRDRLIQLCEGLLTLHRFGIIHCDLKPSNVMMTHDGRVVILDFGVAKYTMHLGAHFQRSEAYAGTRPYMAPEVSIIARATPGLDWYALGMILAELLTGHAPTALAAMPYERLLELFRYAGTKLHPSYASFYALAGQLLHPDPSQRANHTNILELCSPARAAEIDAMAQGRAYLFVGRDEELDELRQALDQFLSGKPVTLIVEGQAGIGKSTLCGEFLRQITLEGNAPYILLARCKNDELLGFRAFDELVDGLAAIMRSMTHEELEPLLPLCTPALVSLFPTLLPFARDQEHAHKASPEDALYALQALLGRIAERRKIIIWVEDVHQADRDSHRWIARIFEPGERPNVLLLLSKRPTHTAAVDHVDIDTLGYAVPVMRLEPLDRSTARHALRQWLKPELRDDEQLIQTLLSMGRGHPHMLQELSRYAHRVKEFDTAPTLASLLAERISALPHPHFLTLYAIARSFDAPNRKLLQHVTELSLSDVDQALEELEHRSLIRQAATAEDEHFELAHATIHECLDDLCTIEQRQRIHTRYADAGIQGLFRPMRPASIVAHLVRAEKQIEAQSYALDLAAAADRTGAYETAAQMYDLLMQVAREQGRRISPSLRARAVECQLRTGRLLDAANLLVELAMEAPPEKARALRRRSAEAYILSGHIAEGNRQSTLAHNEKEKGRFRMLPQALRVAILRHRLERRLENFDPARTTHEALDESSEARMNAYRMSGIDIGMIDAVSAYEFSMRELDFALDTNRAAPIVRALAGFTAFASIDVHDEESPGLKWLKLAHRMSEDIDDLETREWVKICSAAVDYHRGDYRGAWKKITESYVWMTTHASHQSMMLSYLEMHRLFCTVLLGATNGLRTAYYGQIVEARARNNRLMEANVTLAGFLTWLIDDAPEPGRAALRRAQIQTPRKGYQLYDYLHHRSLVELCLYSELHHEIDAHIAHFRRFEWTLLSRSIEMIRHEGRVMRGRLMIARAAKRGTLTPVETLELFSMGTQLTRSSVPLSCGWGHQLLAGGYALHGRRKKAKHHLQEALAIHARAGVHFHAEISKAAGQIAGIFPRTPNPYAELQQMGVVNPERLTRSYHPYIDFVASLNGR